MNFEIYSSYLRREDQLLDMGDDWSQDFIKKYSMEHYYRCIIICENFYRPKEY